MQQSVIREYRNKQRRLKSIALVKLITKVMFYGLLIILIWQIQAYKQRVVMAQNKIGEIITRKDGEIQKQRQEYELKLQIATASPKPQQLSRQQAMQMINSVFPKQIKDRFAKVTMQCENSSLQTDKKNTNKPGLGYDLGLAQINSRFHKDRVEKMFGLPFDVAMGMPVLNYIYAAFLVEHSGLTPWVCDRIV